MPSSGVHRILRVGLDVPLFRLFDYLAPEDAEQAVGRRVKVPFGNRSMTGIVLEGSEDSDVPTGKLRPATKLFTDIPPIDRQLLDLFSFCSDYYHFPLGATVMNALPAPFKTDRAITQKPSRLLALTESGKSAAFSARQGKMLSLREALASGEAVDEARLASAYSGATVRRMLDLGYLAESHAKPVLVDGPDLNPEQAVAVEAIVSSLDGFKPWLLFGITGSGKSEVYLRAIARVLETGRQVLFLVPEISLTPQLEQLFRNRFRGARIVSLHSGLPDGERSRGWLTAQSGMADIVIGTRLSIFTPLRSPGLIVVDEEHDASYKQQDGLRYSARDMAIYRASQLSIPVVLGSATPSLESYHAAIGGRYGLLRLTRRAVRDAALPAIELVDMKPRRFPDGISEPLKEGIASRLQAGQQSLIFVNRRGYAPALACTACSWVPGCRRCTSRLVLHLGERVLRCHFCGHQEALMRACPDCGNIDLKPLGQGTQRIEETLSRLFPSARILRIDRDSTRRRHAWSEMHRQISSGDVDILVGTQILAKGHDFPNLTLVGVVNPDASLYSSDFRASERLYATLAQVSGRAGRAGSAGEVLIQTEFPDHPLFRALKDHDYESMAEMLLAERSAAGFPPFVHQALIRAESPKLDKAMEFLQHVAQAASSPDHGVTIYDPVQAAMPRMDNMERAQILLQSSSRVRLRNLLKELMSKLAPHDRSVKWHVDVDPLEF